MWPFGKKGEPVEEGADAKTARAALLWKQGSKELGRKRYDRAIASLQEAQQLEPSRLEGRLNLGAALFLAGRADEAIPHLRYVLALEPQNTVALLNIAAAYDAVGMMDESIAALENLVADRPQWTDAHYNLGVAYYKREEWDKATTALQAELRLNPKHDAARTLLNEVHLKPRRKPKPLTETGTET